MGIYIHMYIRTYTCVYIGPSGEIGSWLAAVGRLATTSKSDGNSCLCVCVYVHALNASTSSGNSCLCACVRAMCVLYVAQLLCFYNFCILKAGSYMFLDRFIADDDTRKLAFLAHVWNVCVCVVCVLCVCVCVVCVVCMCVVCTSADVFGGYISDVCACVWCSYS